MLNKNLEAIKKTQPDIYTWLSESEKTREEFYLIKANNRDHNLLLKQGSIVNSAYDMDNPRREARKLSRQLNFYQTHCAILVGIGCGHLLNIICKKKEKLHKIIVIEPIADVLKIALSCYDLSSYIEDTSIFFVKTNEEIAGLIGLVDSSFIIEQWHVITEDYTKKFIEDYLELNIFAVKTINQVQCNIGTVMSAGLKLAENDIKNLPYVIRHKGVNELKDIYKDKPAVLVSTGPSLTKNIHHLQNYKDKVIIIAVAQALRILLAYDIKPDFICTVDFGEVNLDHLKGLMDMDVPLVCLNRTYAPLIQQWQGPKFIVATPVPGFENTAVGILEDKGTIEQGGSVAHLCLGLAFHMGCKPIMMIGQDLSLSDKSHCNLVDSGGRIEVDNNGEIQWIVDDPGSSLKKSNTKYSMGYAQFVPGYLGDQVLTNVGLASFISSFEAIIKANENRDITNCTEGGADIKGTKKMSLKKALSSLDKVIKKIDFKNTTASNSKILVRKVNKLIKEDIKTLDDILENSRRGLDTCNKMELAENDEELREFIRKNETYSIAAHNAVKKSALETLAIFKENREINSRELNIKANMKMLLNKEDILKTRIKRNRIILKACIDSAKILKRAYKESLNELQKKDNIKDRVISARNLFDNVKTVDADKYFDVGNWAYPYVMIQDNKVLAEAMLMREKQIIQAKKDEYERQTDKQLRYIEYIEESRKSGKNNIEKSLEYINKAIELYPDKVEARWGKATMLNQIESIDESIIIYQELIKDYPDNLQFKFESCLVLMKKDLMLCVKEFDDLMKITDRFDYFLESIADFLLNISMYKEAKEVYESYLDKFPLNFQAWEKLAKCHEETGDRNSYELCLKKAKKIVKS